MYTNPLDSFQSHSVHYVMLACRSTEDVRTFTDNSPQAASTSLSAIDNTKQLGDEVRIKDANGVYLMMDTRRFSQFTIQNFQMDSLVAGFTVPGSSTPNATAIDMKFTVIDSIGISFANFLQWLMDKKLQVSYDGMTILIRVLFIGHEPGGTSKVVQSVTIPAIFNQIQVDLNDTKGIYECSLFPLIGMPSNAGYNAKWTSIGTASTYFTGIGANTLGAVVKSFEENLNVQLLKRYTDFNGVTQTTKDGNTAIGRYGRPVQYMITLPKDWDTFTFSGPTQGGANETNFKQILADEEAKRQAEVAKAKTAAEAQKKAQTNATAAAKDSYVAVSPSLTVTEVLDLIFGQTVQVAQLGNFTKKQDKDGNIRFYKHLITVTSDNSSFTVHVDVVEFVVPNVMLATSKANNSVSAADQSIYEIKPAANGRAERKVPRNFIELDYVFSGKNLDVLHLDLKIENLNWLLMQNTKLGQGQLWTTADEGQKQEDGKSAGEDKRAVTGMRRMDPTLMPQRTKQEATNFSAQGANIASLEGQSPQAVSQQYTQNLSAFYNAGPITAKLALRGNPDLMAQVSLQAMPKHVSAITITDAGGATSSSNDDVKKDYRKRFERNLLKISDDAPLYRGVVNATFLSGPSHVASPVFVKVNVYGPNVDFLTNELLQGKDFAVQLFYDNFYYLSKITSKIEGSKFTQELELQSFSVYGFPSTNAVGANTPTATNVR